MKCLSRILVAVCSLVTLRHIPLGAEPLPFEAKVTREHNGQTQVQELSLDRVENKTARKFFELFLEMAAEQLQTTKPLEVKVELPNLNEKLHIQLTPRTQGN